MDEAGTEIAALTNGTLIVADDMTASNLPYVMNYAGTPTPSPKRALCQLLVGEIWNEYTFFLPGVATPQGCETPVNGVTDAYADANWIADKIVDGFWQPAGNGYLPAAAIPTGRVQFTNDGKIVTSTNDQNSNPMRALYSCRSMINRDTYLGWTLEGRYCHVKHAGKEVVTRNFDVLALNGDLSEPKPPAPQCTLQEVRNYMNQYQPYDNSGQWNDYGANEGAYSGGSYQTDGNTIPSANSLSGFYSENQYFCTPAEYNEQNPGCNYSISWQECSN